MLSQSLRKSGLCRRLRTVAEIASKQAGRNPFVNQVFVVTRKIHCGISRRNSGRNPFVNQVFVVKNFEAAMAEAVRTSQSLRKSGLCRRA